jgi:hypothetical protein
LNFQFITGPIALSLWQHGASWQGYIGVEDQVIHGREAKKKGRDKDATISFKGMS